MSTRGDRRRAYLYITRRNGEALQVAVFHHPNFEGMVLGQQIPGGTIEPGETPEVGALREAFEESGLRGFVKIRLLATDVWYGKHDGQTRERFFFQLEVAAGTSETWQHTVSAGKLDKGFVFTYYWLEPMEARAILDHMGDYLHLLT